LSQRASQPPELFIVKLRVH